MYNLVIENALAAACCPAWVQAYFIGVVAYSALWYYAAMLGAFARDEARLRLHLLMYALTSSAGYCIGQTATDACWEDRYDFEFNRSVSV